ncbi:bifunctional diaminohydroxyphosphoribosylaminopyrimidine deaminase/5-amino-6-(5-phosphoribosylamino)uracil reductase RibD [Falsigemmobacter faecalis]|uniref:Riboflavin biosynthesis protein RibD n=2 Tax=Falsigemmobacter faecalis TaxID=2488730 RepID=A0A3P3DNZ0_9RHOB|nr:bifunctional diaminohydroxyphosphoribosylaminopyrimidine deaminase/5-amino-6-(5-phosphoribosylamino)uracil reductase RibD [Falsigemmobacter faecalis]
MAHALAMARRGLGLTWPNPAVGCVIVKEGRILGRGTTAPGGRPHAEPQALAQAGAAARGATAYVTLEPCAHTGKTGPCAEALVRAGVARVVSALQDPDPRVAGRGHDILRAAGIAVTTGVRAAEAAVLQEGFLSRITRGRPMLTLKLALSLDGRIATSSGESRWITGPEARARVHLMRAGHDAVMVGAGTARADDPELTLRLPGYRHQPLRIVVSGGLDLPRGGRMEASLPQGRFLLIHGSAAPEEARSHWMKKGAEPIEVASGPSGSVDPEALMQALGDLGLTRVFCEGGGAFAAGLIGADLVDQIEVFTAGVLLGADGRAGLGALGVAALSEAPRFEMTQMQQIGGDLWQSWRRRG